MVLTIVITQHRLNLRVNESKSQVSYFAAGVGLLGFAFYMSRRGAVQICVADTALARLSGRIRALTSRVDRIPMSKRIARLNRYLAGWMGYFALADPYWVFDKLDRRLRRRLRQVRWVEWAHFKGRRRGLIGCGIDPDEAHKWAASRKGSWRIAGSKPLEIALPNAYWNNQGLRSLHQHWEQHRTRWKHQTNRPVRTRTPVVWEGSGGNPGPYPDDSVDRLRVSQLGCRVIDMPQIRLDGRAGAPQRGRVASIRTDSGRIRDIDPPDNRCFVVGRLATTHREVISAA